MLTIRQQYNRWFIYEDNVLILYGFGGIEAALAIARVHGIVLSDYLEVA